jgi:hypothetical protein
MFSQETNKFCWEIKVLLRKKLSFAKHERFHQEEIEVLSKGKGLIKKI